MPSTLQIQCQSGSWIILTTVRNEFASDGCAPAMRMEMSAFTNRTPPQQPRPTSRCESEKTGYSIQSSTLEIPIRIGLATAMEVKRNFGGQTLPEVAPQTMFQVEGNRVQSLSIYCRMEQLRGPKFSTKSAFHSREKTGHSYSRLNTEPKGPSMH